MSSPSQSKPTLPINRAHVLLNPLGDPSQPTPSNADSLSPELESELRLYGGLLIQQAGILLKLPQIVMATAATLFQRFYLVTSFLHFGIRDVSAGSLFLASKLEEKPARLRDIINVYDYLFQLIRWSRAQREPPALGKNASAIALKTDTVREARSRIESNPLLPPALKASMIKHLEQQKVSDAILPCNPDDDPRAAAVNDVPPAECASKKVVDLKHFKYVPMDYFAPTFYSRKEEIVVAEMQILKRLGFRVQVQHPYSAMVNYLRVLDLTNHDYVPQRAWGYLNDCLLTRLPALYPPTHLATLSIYLATADQNLPLPEAWWELFDVSSDSELEDMGAVLRSIYTPSQSDRSPETSGPCSFPTPDGMNSPCQAQKQDSIWIRVSDLPITKEEVRKVLEDTKGQGKRK